MVDKQRQKICYGAGHFCLKTEKMLRVRSKIGRCCGAIVSTLGFHLKDLRVGISRPGLHITLSRFLKYEAELHITLPQNLQLCTKELLRILANCLGNPTKS